ncbi:hypothetical protein GCM10020331_065000 [Ectobacillus funiculus]
MAGIEVEEAIGDMAYSEKDNISYCQEEDIKLISKLNPVVTQGIRKKEDEFEFNKDAGMFVCKAGHLAIRKKRHGKTGTGKNPTLRYYFDVKKCQTCPFQEGCYKKRSQKQNVFCIYQKYRTDRSGRVPEQRVFLRKKAKERYKIEAKKQRAKNTSTGMMWHSPRASLAWNYKEQWLFFTVNLKRIFETDGAGMSNQEEHT